MQNLHELYKIQDELKKRIGYKGPDKFEKMMLAMITEMAECANDWQGFKYWKKNNKPKETLLEETVDILHFILETGLDLQEDGFVFGLPNEVLVLRRLRDLPITDHFKQLIYDVIHLEMAYINGGVGEPYITLFGDYLALCEKLGFTEDQIAAAYLKKVAINHERQDTGY